MSNTVTRKCNGCENPVIFNKDTKDGIVLHKGRYYHTDCFITMAQGKAARKGSLPLWQQALNSIQELEAEAIKQLKAQWTKDELNLHLLANYDIAAVPSSFWTTVAELGNGMYGQKRCRPIDLETLLGVWRWGQRNLDKIAVKNKMQHTGPQDDMGRLRYDLAILIGKIPLYLKEKAKAEMAKQELSQNLSTDDVDMSKVGQKQTVVQKKNLSDIAADILVD